jgi:hypothetical protein
VFFDDLLIYSMTWEEHLQHVEQILTIMEGQSLYAKESKCEFGMIEVLYLGHIIGVKGVQVHQENIQAIVVWPVVVLIHTCKREQSPTHLVCPCRHNA